MKPKLEKYNTTKLINIKSCDATENGMICLIEFSNDFMRHINYTLSVTKLESLLRKMFRCYFGYGK